MTVRTKQTKQKLDIGHAVSGELEVK